MKLSLWCVFAVAFFALMSVLWAQQSSPPDLSVARGDYSADIKVLQRDGSLAAGLPYKLQLNIKGEDPDIETGTIPEDGIIRLKGLAGDDGGASYLLLVGTLDLEAERFELTGPKRHRTLEFMMAPAPGDPAPDIPLQGLFDREMSHLSDYRGQYVILDFWATWCPPCYAPMTETEEALREHADDWKGKVAVVALSIDDTPEPAREFVRKREWLSMNHYWSSEGEPGFFSDAMRAYRIDNIPTMFLIGPDGTILWRGEANEASSEELIEDALAAGD